MSKKKRKKSGVKAPSRNQKRSINFWQMWRDVLIASLSKGQFATALLGMIVILVIVKMPASDVSKLAFEIIEDIRENLILSFFVSPLITLAWFFHAKWQRKTWRDEIKRVSDEKNKIQKELNGSITSSENNY